MAPTQHPAGQGTPSLGGNSLRLGRDPRNGAGTPLKWRGVPLDWERAPSQLGNTLPKLGRNLPNWARITPHPPTRRWVLVPPGGHPRGCRRRGRGLMHVGEAYNFS